MEATEAYRMPLSVESGRAGGCKGVVKDGACGSGPVGHKGSWPYREEEAYTLYKDHLLLCVFHSKSTAAETNTHTP